MTRNQKVLVFSCMVWVFFLGAGLGTVAAQVPYCVSGFVQDVQGAALAGVTVTAVNLSTGQTLNATTNSDGFYQIDVPVAGLYDISTLGQTQTILVDTCPTSAYFPASSVAITVATGGSLTFTVDGFTFIGSHTFYFQVESTHTIATTSPQVAGATRYLFSDWSDTGAISHSIGVSGTPATYTATFFTQYLLTTMASPSAGGSVAASPASADGFYDSGTPVQLTATANSGYAFTGFSGDLTGSTNPQSIVMSAPRNVTALFAPYISITVTTNPAGLSFSADGQTYATAQSFLWVSGTSHTIATTTPQGSGTTRYVFANWSDSAAISHSILVPSAPATYTATFTTQYLLTATASPTTGGNTGANPSSVDGFYDTGTSVQLTATANSGYAFAGFSGNLTGSTNPQSIVMSAPRNVTALFAPYISITVTTNPAGLSFSADGQTYAAAQSFPWVAGSSHTIAITTPQGTGTTRYVFANWSDSGGMSHSITTPGTATAYVANFTTQYLLAAAVVPAGGGTISRNPGSSDGFYDRGTNVEIKAVPAAGQFFISWSGSVGSSANPEMLAMSQPRSVTATFDTVTAVSISSINPSRAYAGGTPFYLTVNGSGFIPGISTVYWNGVARTTIVPGSSLAVVEVDSTMLGYPGMAAVTVVNPQAAGGSSNPLNFTIDPPPSPTPTILAMTPVSAVAGGPTFDLQVYGANFLPGSVVRWNGTDRFTLFLSSKQLRATITSADISLPGPKSVTVASPGVVSGAMTFTVSAPAPQITALSPPAVAAGSPDFTLTIYGLNFLPGAAVQWNGVARPTTVVGNSQLRTLIPASDAAAAGNFAISVLNVDGSRSAGKSISVIALPPNAPTITSVSPEPIAAGGPAFMLIVFGSGFLPNAIVQFNGQARATRFISGTELRADIPASDIATEGVFSILVANPASYGYAQADSELAGSGSVGLSTVTTPVPLITTVTPGSVVAGTAGLRLTIGGFGFVKDATYVQWNDKRVLANFTNSTEITADIPAADVAAEGTLDISVLNPPPGGGTSDSHTFTMTPKKAAALQLFYPRLESSAAANATENTGIAIANLSGNDASITLRAFGRDGAEIAGPKITNPVTLSISGVEQRAITDSQVFGSGLPAQNSVGWMKLESSQAKVAGFFLVFDNNLQTLDGADVSSSVVASFVFPELEGSGSNQFHLANPGASAAAVTFELYGTAGGSPKATATRNINPNGTLAEFFTDLFPGVSAASTDYIRVTSNQGLVPFSYMRQPGRDARGLNGQDVTKGSTVLYSPQYVVGGPDWKTTLSIVNLDSASTTVMMRFIGDDGMQIGSTQVRTIAGKGKLFVGNQDFFLSAGQLTQGYVEVTSDGARLAGSVVFGDPQGAGYTAALPLVQALQTSMVFGQVASGLVGDNAYFTGLAMLNPAGTDAHVLVELFNRDGRLVTSSSETVPANRRKSKVLTEFFPALTGQNISSGYIKVTSDRGLASFALFGTKEALSAVPAQIVP
jgi:hypothetical protein